MRVNGNLTVNGNILGRHIFSETDDISSFVRGANIDLSNLSLKYVLENGYTIEFLNSSNIISFVKNLIPNNISDNNNSSNFEVILFDIYKFLSYIALPFPDESDFVQLLFDPKYNGVNFNKHDIYDIIKFIFVNSEGSKFLSNFYYVNNEYFSIIKNEELLSNFFSVILKNEAIIDHNFLDIEIKNFFENYFNSIDVTEFFNNFFIFNVNGNTTDVTFLPYLMPLSFYILSCFIDVIEYLTNKKFFKESFERIYRKELDPIIFDDLVSISYDGNYYLSVYVLNTINLFELSLSYLMKKIFYYIKNGLINNYDINTYLMSNGIDITSLNLTTAIISINQYFKKSLLDKFKITDFSLQKIFIDIIEQDIYELSNNNTITGNVITENINLNSTSFITQNIFDSTFLLKLPLFIVKVNIDDFMM